MNNSSQVRRWGQSPHFHNLSSSSTFFGVGDLDSRYSFAVWPGHAASCLAVWQFIWLSPPVSPEHRLEHTLVQVRQFRDLHRQSSFRPISLKRSLSIRLLMNLLQSMLAEPTAQGTSQIVQRKPPRRPSTTNQRSKVAAEASLPLQGFRACSWALMGLGNDVRQSGGRWFV